MTGTRGGRRAWQLPQGVSAGTWDYVAEPSIATEYDAYHGDHPLMRLDVQLLREHLRNYPTDPMGALARQPCVADFGCGTGRIGRMIEPLGYRVLNIDLSSHMLRQVQSQTRQSERSSCVQSNLVELEWLAEKSIDVAVCLFSSIGMIRGRPNRRRFLEHVRRSLRPGGGLLLHVHNRGHSWRDPHGPAWLISTAWKRFCKTGWEFGDRVYSYRGLPSMFLHIYSQSELRGDLRAAGFMTPDITPIHLTGRSLISKRSPLLYLRAGGFFAWASAEGTWQQHGRTT